MNKRFTYIRGAMGGWVIIDISTQPAAQIGMAFDRGDLFPLMPVAAKDEGEHQARHLCELLNRDHEMRVAVDAAKRGES